MGTAVQEAAAEFTSRLEAAVRRTLPPLDEGFAVPILFSGGVDSLMIALLAGRVLRGQTQIVLINVAFGDTPEVGPFCKSLVLGQIVAGGFNPKI